MKRILLSVVLSVLTLGMSAMSLSKMRTHARFLTDRMAYELDLSSDQYDDCYEINYDFIYAIEGLMDDVVYGYEDAIDSYYRYLDYRNEDLAYVLDYVQYDKFIRTEYFYRPVYTKGGSWDFRIYIIYNNVSFYYFDKPLAYNTYVGLHSRRYYSNGYYTYRYNHMNRYSYSPIRGGANISVHRRNDFGMNIRKRGETNIYNNYNNKNANYRTQDRRYRDDSGNRYSPGINNRIVERRRNDVGGTNQNKVIPRRRGDVGANVSTPSSSASDRTANSSRYRVDSQDVVPSRTGSSNAGSNNGQTNQSAGSEIRVGRK